MLTLAEQKELEELEKEFGGVETVPRGLSKSESEELAELEKEFGPKPEPESLPKRLVRSSLDALPVAGALAGGAVSTPGTLGLGTVAGGAVGYAGGKKLSQLGKHYLLGDPLEAKGLIESSKDAAKDLRDGAFFEMGGQIIGKAPGLIARMGKGVKNFAEKTAVNATGATGKQASEFADDAGRQLLDRKMVRFGDSQEKIAKRVAEGVKKAEKEIDSALKTLDEKGVKVDENAILDVIKAKIKDLSKDPSKADVVSLLNKELENVKAAGEVRGSTMLSPSEAEAIKRGYNRKAGNWMDPEKGMAGKEMYHNYRDVVEATAEAEAPATGMLFKDAKESYGLLRPIQEAAERRAATTNQSPAGGFLDVTTALGGAAAGGPVAAIAAPIARRFIAPRMSSSTAVAADKIADALLTSQYFQRMAKQNPEAFNALVISFANKESAIVPKAAAEER